MTMSSQVTIVENGMSRQGWRRVHFMTAQEAVMKGEKERILMTVPWESAKWTQSMVYEEAGIWHCKLYWPVRGEVVKVQLPSPEAAQFEIATSASLPRNDKIVLWVMFRRDDDWHVGLDIAVWRYFGWFDAWPDTVWIGGEMDVLQHPVVKIKDKSLTVVEAKWMPRMGLGVGVGEVYLAPTGEMI